MAKKPMISHDMRESARFVYDSAFWKHLEKMMQELYENSLTTDAMDLSKLSIALLAEGRGIRRAVTAIREEIQQHLA